MPTKPLELRQAPGGMLRAHNSVARAVKELQRRPVASIGQVETIGQQRDALRFGKVTAIYNIDGTAWTSFAASGKLPVYCKVNPCNIRGEAVQAGVTLKLKMNNDPSATAGVVAAVDDVVAYLWPATPWELIPSRASDSELGYQGYVVAGPGGAGATDGLGTATLSIGQYVNFPITLSQTGGSAGDESSGCSFTYNVTDTKTGVSLGTNVNVTASPHTYNRPTVGEQQAADAGLAYYNSSGQLVITWINEQDATEACA